MSTINDKQLKSHLKDITNSIKDTRSDMNRGFSSIKDALGKVGDSVKEGSNNKGGFGKGDKDDMAETIKDSIAKAYTGLQLHKLVSSMDKASSTLIKATNSMQQLGVGTYKEVEKYREFVKSTQKQLNSITGNSYNLQKMYEDIATLAKESDIARIDTLKEVTKPAMLAYRAMNVSLSSIADISSKLYEFASFDSLKLEGLFDHVKTISNGMNVNEQTIIDSMNILSSTLTARAYKDGYKVDNEKIYEGISNLVATLEDSGIDSKEIVNLMDSYMEGDIDARKTMLKLTGRDDWADDFLTGNTSEFSKALMDTGSDWFESFSNGLENASSDALGISYDLLESIYNAKESGRWVRSLSTLNNNLLNPTSMADTVKDQHKDLKDQFTNWMSSSSEFFADSREFFKVSMAQVVSLIGIGWSIYRTVSRSNLLGGDTKGLLSKGPNGKSMLSSIGSKMLNSKIGADQYVKTSLAGEAMGLKGTAATIAGSAATIGGVAAGGALAIDGIKGMLDEDASVGSRVTNGVQAGLGVGGAGAVLALGASNPIGWAVLAAGGLLYLGKKAYENAHELDGNAKAAIESLKQTQKSLQDENTLRLKSLGTLKVAYEDASSIDEKRRLLSDAGIARMDELQSLSEAGLDDLIYAYTEGAKKLNSVTESIIEFRKDEVSEQQDVQKKELIGAIQEMMLNGDTAGAQGAITQLMAGVTDQDLLSKYDKYMKDNKLSSSEMNDLLYGGKNAWFDKVNLTDMAVDVGSMRASDSLYVHTGQDYVDFNAQDEYAMADLFSQLNLLYESWATAPAGNAKDILKNQVISFIDNNIRTSEYLEAMKSSTKSYKPKLDAIAQGLGIQAFKVGTDYVDSDQLALIHEGEAIIPKENNPVANVAELEMLRRQASINNSNSDDKLVETVNDLVGVVKTILTVFNEYVEEVDKRYNDDKLNDTIKNNKIATNKSLLEFLM